MAGWRRHLSRGRGGGGEHTSDNKLTGPDGGGSGLYQRDDTACPVVSAVTLGYLLNGSEACFSPSLEENQFQPCLEEDNRRRVVSEKVKT